MEAIFGLLRTNPADEELLTAACAVCEQLSSWSELLSVISKESTTAEITCKAHLRTLSRCLKSTKLSEWPLQHIERVLVASLPRWGTLIPKDSLGNIFEFLGVIVTHGLGILNVRANSVSPGIPRSVLDEISVIRLKLLQLIWFSSALSTLTTVLKCTVGEGEGDIVNVLLQHNSESESLKQTVVEAQEQALLCLGSLFECVSFSNHDESLDQLSQVLKQLCCDFQDSSSLPLVLSVSSFIVGASKVKVRAETVDAAAFCLAGIVKVCDLSPSLFQQSTRVKGEDIIGSCLDGIKARSSVSCVDLLESFSVNLPSLCVGSKVLVEGVQTLQSLHRVANRLIPELALPISIPANFSLTSGEALALSMSGEKEKISDFLTKSVLDKEWLKSHFLLPRENVKHLSNLYSLLQSERVRPEWIFSGDGGKFSEPSLRHFIPKKTISKTFPDITAILSQLMSCEAVIDSCNALLISFFEKDQQSEILLDLKNAVLSLLSEVEIDAVRETPQLVDKTLRILELICQQEISKGLPLTQPAAVSPGAEQIVTQLVLSTLSFSRNPSHCPLINQALRCVPYFAPGKDSEIVSAIIESVPPALALSSCPAALSCLESLLTAVAHHQIAASMEYVSSVLEEFSNKSEVLPDSVVVELLSLTSSFLLKISESSPTLLSLLNSKSVWTLLATHPAIRSAATARSWEQPNSRYSTKHLVWIHALHLAEVLLSVDLNDGADKFIHSFAETLSERYLTAHTSDLASLEEACLISRIAELSGLLRLHPFQFTSLVTPKPPSLYPKSRAEKLAGGLPASNIADDVRLPCEVPSVFAQRVVWIAADILSSALRNISRNGASNDQTTQTLFHSLLDCSHFFVQYLNEVSIHKARVLQIVRIGTERQDFVPLSVHLSVDGRDLGNTNTLPPIASRTSTGGGSLLHSMSSPLSTAKKATLKNDAPASLMDSLTPRNSPKSQPVAPGEGDIRFLPAVTADCSLRTGLTFIAPSLVSEDDFVAKLVEVLSLCLILATRLATTEALIRPLLDLLLTTQSNKDRLPIEALDIISELVELVTPRYEQFAAIGRSRTTHQSLPGQTLISSQFPAIMSSPLGYSALSNIR